MRASSRCCITTAAARVGCGPQLNSVESLLPYSYATHLECSVTGERHDIGKLQGLSAAGKPLLVRYDLATLRRDLGPEAIEARPAEMWRWHELLPLPRSADRVSLGEVETPLIALLRSERPAGS